MQNLFLCFSLSLAAAAMESKCQDREDTWLNHLHPASRVERQTWYQRSLAQLGDLLIATGRSLKRSSAVPQAVAWTAR